MREKHKIYRVTTSQFIALRETIQYMENGDKVIVENRLTGKVDEYVVETKKVLTKKKSWEEE